PRLLDPVVERHVSVELVEIALVDLLERVRLVEPERRRSEPYQPQRERNDAHDEKIEGERPRAHALHEARPAADDRGSDVDRLAHHSPLSVVAHGCISGDPLHPLSMRYRAGRASTLSWQSRLDDEPAADVARLWPSARLADLYLWLARL